MVVVISELFYPAGVILLAGFVMLLQQWQYIQIFLTAFSGTAVLHIW